MSSHSLDHARAVLQRTFGYPDFRGGQADAVAAALQRRDTLVLMPTGGGKSLCYQVPALTLGGLTLVVSPLISLMKDQVDALVRRGVPAAALHSGLSTQQAATILADAAAGRLALLYVAPERFDAPAFRDTLPHLAITLIAVDEAHCISQWGYDFRPAYLRIGNIRDTLRCPVLALTATATPDVRNDIIRRLRLREPVVITRGFDRTNLAWHAFDAGDGSRRQHLLRDLLRARDGGTAIAYAATRRAVDAVTDALNRSGLRAAGYHAGIPPDQRATLQDRFIAGHLNVIVATNAFGMGIDKPDVRLVVHFTMASSLEGYYQEAGRAGRDGQPAHCALLHAARDRITHEFLIDQAHPPRRAVEAFFTALARATTIGQPSALSPGLLSRATGGTCAPAQASSALRVLSDAGIIRVLGPEAAPPRLRFIVPADRARECLRNAGRHDDADHLRAAAALLARSPGHDTLRRPGPELLARLQQLHDDGWVELRRSTGRTRIERLLAAPPARLPIDWTALNQRRRHELARLARMQGYAFTRHCRRAYLLRYFGDPDTPSACTGCDNCLGPHHRLLPHARPPRGPSPALLARQLALALAEHIT